MPTIDFTRLHDQALLRSREFLRPGPVPMGRTLWHEMVADGRTPAPAAWKGHLTARKWADIRRFLADAAADGGRLNGRPWPSSMSTNRATAKVAESDKIADIPGEIFKEYDRQPAVV